ncbi:MAG: hypothetical protein ABFD90_08045 [Phycisphaerales bacterium]
MKRVVFLTVLLAAVTALGQDWEGDLQDETAVGKLHTMVGVTWDSKYIWRGFDIFDDKSATHLSIDLNLFETGFGASLVGHRANGSGFEDLERWDGTLYYQSGAWAGESYATNYRFGFVHYLYPELNEGESLDQQEGQMVLAWPNLLPVQGLQPSYALIKMWPADSGSRLSDAASGWMHILMLDYGFSVPGILAGMPDHVITLHSEVVHNGGLSVTPRYRNPDYDWTHAVLGASTDFSFGPGGNLVLTPAVYYQITMESSISEDGDKDNELWVSLALKYAF